MNFQIEGTQMVAVVGALLAVMLGLIGWLLRRAIEGIDAKLTSALDQSANHEGRLIRIETQLGFGQPELSQARHRTTTTNHD